MASRGLSSWADSKTEWWRGGVLGGGGDNEPCLSFLWLNTDHWFQSLFYQSRTWIWPVVVGFWPVGSGVAGPRLHLHGCVMLTSPASAGRSLTHPHTDYHCWRKSRSGKMRHIFYDVASCVFFVLEMREVIEIVCATVSPRSRSAFPWPGWDIYSYHLVHDDVKPQVLIVLNRFPRQRWLDLRPLPDAYLVAGAGITPL